MSHACQDKPNHIPTGEVVLSILRDKKGIVANTSRLSCLQLNEVQIFLQTLVLKAIYVN
jgi:hypothetical protein